MNMREKWTIHCVHKSGVAIFIMSHSWVSHAAFGIDGESNNTLPDLPEKRPPPLCHTHTISYFFYCDKCSRQRELIEARLRGWRGHSPIRGKRHGGRCQRQLSGCSGEQEAGRDNCWSSAPGFLFIPRGPVPPRRVGLAASTNLS